MIKNYWTHIFVILSIWGISCASPKSVKKIPVGYNHATHIQTRLIEGNEKFDQHFYGLLIYDPQNRDTLVSINADKYFTPASNTKLLTFLLSKKLLRDSLTGLRYYISGDSLVFKGTGDPGFLLNKNSGKHLNGLLKNTDHQLYFDPSNYRDRRLGSGWAWEDSKYLYQKNKSGFPIYGNELDIIKNDSISLATFPKLFRDSILHDPSKKYAQRNLYSNIIHLDSTKYLDWSFPIYQSDELFMKLLADTLNKEINLVQNPIQTDWQGLAGSPTDTLFERLLLYSDNFIAEQLLLNLSEQELGYMNTQDIIKHALDSILVHIPDKPRWVDGSGLSRYNLVTPRSMIWVLGQIQNLLSIEEIKAIFPCGKQEDTLPMKYDQDYFIFAKTGTLSNNHNISGFLFTKSNRVLLFSFMNNHYMYPKKELVAEMKKILEYARDNF